MTVHVTLSENLNNDERSSGANSGEQLEFVQMNCTPPPPSHDNVYLPPDYPVNLITVGGAPPSYDEVNDRNAPPPSYDSLFGRVREIHKSSRGVFNFLLNIAFLLLGTISYTIIIGLSVILPLAMVIIGGVYLRDCPQSEYIPVYLLVGGGINLFKQVFSFSVRVFKTAAARDEERARQSPVLTLINCFTVGWFIIGSMWVYKEYEPNYDPSLGKYCNKTLYLFAFWLITLNYIALGIAITILIFISVMSIIF